jgi:hypothetical protein
MYTFHCDYLKQVVTGLFIECTILTLRRFHLLTTPPPSPQKLGASNKHIPVSRVDREREDMRGFEGAGSTAHGPLHPHLTSLASRLIMVEKSKASVSDQLLLWPDPANV